MCRISLESGNMLRDSRTDGCPQDSQNILLKECYTMEYGYLFPVLGAIVLILLSDSLHGPVQTESEVIKDEGGSSVMYYLVQATKYVNTVVALVILTLGTLLGLDAFLPGMRDMADAFIGPYRWWMVWVPGFNVASAIVVWGIFVTYSKRKFGSARPDYEHWDEFQERSRRPTNTTLININGQGWNPFQTGQKPSLSDRASTRSSSKAKASSRSSNVMAMPVPMPVSSNRTSSTTRRSSRSSSSSGDGDWVKILAQLGIFLLAILVLIVYGFIAWKVNDGIMDFWDEVFVENEFNME